MASHRIKRLPLKVLKNVSPLVPDGGATVGKAAGIAGAMKGGVGIGIVQSADVTAAAGGERQGS